MQQHVGDARDRDEIGDAVAPLRQAGKRHRQWRLPGIRGRSQRIGKATARQPDLVKQCSQHYAHPHRLLAMLGALQGLRAGDQGALACGTAPQCDDLDRRKAADRRCPGSVFRQTVAATEQISLEGLPADAEPVEEGAVVPTLGHQRVRQPQHQCDIGAGPDRMPDRTYLHRQIVAQRADQVEFDAALARGLQMVAGDVLARTAAADIVVFERHAAKGEHQARSRPPARPS